MLGYVPMHMICLSKSPLLTDKWLKGFWNPSTYDRDIGNQSWHTNRGTPCSITPVAGCNESKQRLEHEVKVQHPCNFWAPNMMRKVSAVPVNLSRIRTEQNAVEYSYFPPPPKKKTGNIALAKSTEQGILILYRDGEGCMNSHLRPEEARSRNLLIGQTFFCPSTSNSFLF